MALKLNSIRPAGACAALALLAVVGAPADPAIATPAPEAFSFTGHGYGHGVGMSQYGAYAMARNGSTAAQILQRYYPGTTLDSAASTTLRVLVQQTARTISLHAAAPLHLRDANGLSADVPPNQTVAVSRSATTFSVSGAGVTTPDGWTAPVTVSAAGGSPIVVEGNAPAGGTGRSYRGTIRVLADGGYVDAVNVVPLDDYVKGVVPSEMPSGWPAAALQAQAVAARSYALAGAGKGTRPFDVYADTRSQVYGGISAEAVAASSAVDATAGQVVEYDGQVATTYFSSSDGGRTADPVEAGLTQKPVPYLQSTPDPDDDGSPYHDWNATVTAADAATALGYAGTITSLAIDAYPSGRVRNVLLDGSAGPLTVPGPKARTALGLRSTWFALQAPLSLSAPAISGVQVRLSGSAPDGQVALQGTKGATWRTIATITAAGGSVAFNRPLGEAARYRLLAGATPSNVVRVSVATGLALKAPRGSTFRGRLYPGMPGRIVLLQRRHQKVWSTVSRTRSGPGGVLRFKTAVTSGTWRAHFQGDGILLASSSGLARPAKKPTRTQQAVQRRAVPKNPQSVSSTQSFPINDTLYPRQWNLREINAFGAFNAVPQFPTRVTVAIIDGGVDSTVRDLQKTNIQSVSFVKNDQPPLDHGTAIAGIIAAQTGNDFGIAGIDPSVHILDLRVVEPDGSVDPAIEAAAIKYAVNAARASGDPLVINLSLGGTRDPIHPANDEYSPVEQGAIDYAYRAGAVLVAPTGNSNGPTPYQFASYPAALQHVLGVSADDHGTIPAFSNRDARFNDLTAPGADLVTTVSRATSPTGLSVSAPAGAMVSEDGTVEGTSFAAPHVAAAAALLLGAHPNLTNSQVMELLEQSARQIGPSTPGRRDPASGFGVLDIGGAMTLATWGVPRSDRGEPNDDGSHTNLLDVDGQQVFATIDWGDDAVDAYRVSLTRGQTVTFSLDSPEVDMTGVRLAVYNPGTVQLVTQQGVLTQYLKRTSADSNHLRLQFTAPSANTYVLGVLATDGGSSGPYRLSARTSS
jgi:stage II sporulation protein D